ncbi:MAG: SapC family protein [Duganella sp.]
MIFYQKPVALNRERHRNLKLAAATGDFSFSQHTNSLLIAATELVDAAMRYPVVFVGQPGGPYALAAMVGLSEQKNLFLKADGSWEADCYIPAFARRYPFVLAEGQGATDELTVCVDEAFSGLNEEHGEALFDAEGRETPMLQGAVDFLRLYHAEMQQTHLFTQRLAALDVLVPKTVEVESNGKKQVVDGFFIIDAARLQALDDAALVQLVRSGDMQLIDAHLFSLKQITSLAIRIDRVHADAVA